MVYIVCGCVVSVGRPPNHLIFIQGSKTLKMAFFSSWESSSPRRNFSEGFLQEFQHIPPVAVLARSGSFQLGIDQFLKHWIRSSEGKSCEVEEPKKDIHTINGMLYTQPLNFSESISDSCSLFWLVWAHMKSESLRSWTAGFLTQRGRFSKKNHSKRPPR